MKTKWIVQVNHASGSPSPEQLRRACECHDLDYVGISVKPGNRDLSAIANLKPPFVFHGGTTLILSAYGHPDFQTGVFYQPSHFGHRAYAAGFEKRLLNYDADISSIDQFLRSRRNDNDLIFIKPIDDLKGFTGDVLRYDEWVKFLKLRCSTSKTISFDTEVVIGSPQELDGEWRLFIVEGTVIAGSMYKPTADPILPEGLLQFATEAVKVWEPAPVFVLDVGRVDRTWKIVECNCFNWSRFYASNVNDIIKAVSEYQES